ncbi:leucine-rich repeat domain-containing protein [Symbiopectobacterium purcellii]|uniref:leucine-rich repeat domain-containing protein n=1 Tax=Symbiopectobacterium purcellii TaxID=2871826 RepID=UPI003F8439F7
MLTIKKEGILYSKSLMNTTPAIAISSQATTSEQNEWEYYKIWSEWGKNSSQRMGEQRDVAVALLNNLRY